MMELRQTEFLLQGHNSGLRVGDSAAFDNASKTPRPRSDSKALRPSEAQSPWLAPGEAARACRALEEEGGR
jgi:hypothetical protein